MEKTLAILIIPSILINKCNDYRNTMELFAYQTCESRFVTEYPSYIRRSNANRVKNIDGHIVGSEGKVYSKNTVEQPSLLKTPPDK